jgi:hypothetical protein
LDDFGGRDPIVVAGIGVEFSPSNPAGVEDDESVSENLKLGPIEGEDLNTSSLEAFAVEVCSIAGLLSVAAKLARFGFDIELVGVPSTRVVGEVVVIVLDGETSTVAVISPVLKL